jgi:hypothetical protein
MHKKDTHESEIKSKILNWCSGCFLAENPNIPPTVPDQYKSKKSIKKMARGHLVKFIKLTAYASTLED